MRNIFLLVSVSFFVLISCKTESKREIKTETIAFKKEGDLSIFKVGTDSIVSNFDIEIADTDYETQTGLMYRASMEENQGMLFIFPKEAMHSFYMKNTEFPLDIIYIDGNQKIASFQKNAQPYNESSLPSKVPVQYVLEVNAGVSDQLGLQVGDSISFTRN
ncbi:DUF192 domain-containing protein [Muricauda sp. MAR_2010_75]|uniref:DUF192 domain-containing protein n=1 Tax=Allomuricauda sp. MAR_2010_75 TaxID=1250232 RepID=UPI00056682DB|nr:DUF192 domain-containing protein [Muricauda sp. MAR_2010_75]